MRHRALGRARYVEGRIDVLVGELAIAAPHRLFEQLRAYLVEQNRRLNATNRYDLLKIAKTQNDVALLNVGPTIDQGPSATHFNFPSGSRLSFGVAVRATTNTDAELISYRFQINGSSGHYIRFDLAAFRHNDPVAEPRCHIHPDSSDIRIPTLPMAPLTLLDYIFFQLEPSL
jgi:hypothetical protein